jgi:hypothetical protein
MGSIFHDSTVTLAATDSPDSSGGLFMPDNGVVPLATQFAAGRGRVYVKLVHSPWHIPSPCTRVERGVLQSRGWVMQERHLSRRTLHFLKGQMLWTCSEGALGQGGYTEKEPGWEWDDNLQSDLKIFSRAFDGAYRGAWSDDDVAEAKAAAGDGEVYGTTIIDLRGGAHQNKAAPTPIGYDLNDELYIFIDKAIKQTIYHVWYKAVRMYTERDLTFPKDKLPALAGLVSRVHEITNDDYLAGHWRRELERSLFWGTDTLCGSKGHPARVKEYRAPSWSWASVDGYTSFDFVGISCDQKQPTTIEILEASVHVDGQNPFGRVTGGRIIMRASVVRASWQSKHYDSSWVIGGCATVDVKSTHVDDLKFSNSNNKVVGFWHYDDVSHGIIPGPLLDSQTSVEEAVARSVPTMCTRADDPESADYLYCPDANNKDTLWERGTYVPEDLVLVKGPTHQSDGERVYVDVLVLARIKGQDGAYRRVGEGSVHDWDVSEERVETLTVV